MKLASRCLPVALCLVLARAATAEDVPRKPDSAIGEVVAFDAAASQLTLKPDSGENLTVTLLPDAALMRAKPGGTSLKDAASLSFAEIASGDRVLVRGTAAADHRSFTARQVVVMTRADIAQKQDADRALWRSQSVLGAVTAVDLAKGEITLRTGRGAATQPVVVDTTAPAVTFRRYAPDSVRFSDARPSTLGEVKVGDQVRALGERTGDRVAARQIVFGTFRTLSGAVTAVDAGRGELVLMDDTLAQAVTVSVGSDARLHQLPPEFAARLAAMAAAPPREAGGPPPDGAAPRFQREAGGASPGGAAPRFQREGGRAPEDMLERLPHTTLADLKPGDRVLISSTEGHDSARANAIVLVSGLPALPAGTARSGRGARGLQVGVPSDMLDLGMSLQ
jgi:hypothetical protein